MRSWKRVLLVAIPAGLLLAAVAVAFFSAQRTLNRSTQTTLAAKQTAFTLRTIDLASTASSAFELVASPPSFTAGEFLDQEVYLAGPAGLSIYAADGTLRQTLRTGVELPVEPIVAVATGRLRGSAEPEVLLATSGSGLLLRQPSRSGPPRLSQLLPAQTNARDLTALLPLSSGDLLLGTRHGGVLVWNGATLSPFRFNLPDGAETIHPATLEVTALAAPDAASFLIGTRTAGLFYVHGGTVQHVGVSDGLPDRQIESLLIANHKAYAGTPLGVAEFDLAAEVFHPQRVLARGLFSHALAYDASTHQLAVGTLDQSVQQVALNVVPRLRNASIVAPHDVATAPTGDRIDAFLAPAAGSPALFAIAAGELVRQSGNSWTPALTPPVAALADRNISALAFAPDGSLYAGFFDHGLDILSPEGGSIRHLEDDHLFCVNRLVLDPVRQTIAAATADGLVLFDRQGIPRQTLTRRDGLISDHITDLAFTRDGMTIATPAGLTFAGPEGMQSLYAFQGLVNNHVYALATGANDHLLAGTLGGISLLESGAVRRNFTVTNSGLKHNWVTAMVTFATGYLVGTYGAGIEQLAPDGTFRAIDLPAGVPHDLIINPNAIFAAGNHVYAGTLDHGMLVYSAATGRWSNITRGLPSLNVTAFAERNGELYIGTENGLVRIAEAKLEAQLQ